MYKYVLNLVIKISLMFAQYFEYYAIILRGAVFCGHSVVVDLKTRGFKPRFPRGFASGLQYSSAAVEYSRGKLQLPPGTNCLYLSRLSTRLFDYNCAG